MVRRFAPLVMLLTLGASGCRSGGQTFENPFQTRVEPPGTALPGTLPATPGAYDPNANVAPLFTPNNSAAAAEPPAVLQPSTTAPAAPAGVAPQYAPPGGFDFRASQATPVSLPPSAATQPGATIYRPAGAVSSPSQSRWGNGSVSTETNGADHFAQPPSSAGVVQASALSSDSSGVAPAAVTRSPRPRADNQPIRVIGSPTNREERTADSRSSTEPRSTSTPRDPREPRRLPQDDQAIDIMDLPPAGARSAASRVRPTVERTSYRRPAAPQEDVQAEDAIPEGAAEEESDRPATRANTIAQRPSKRVSNNHASYGHDPDYAWLKGQLEYSNIDRRWKLRYIPIDGQTDAHGGSVVLPDSPLLETFESGDFIAVQGVLAGKASSGYAPVYELSRVKRLAL